MRTQAAKTTRPLSILRSTRGQALTEYVLILVVVVALILGTVYQFNDAIRVWANNYFGEYVACLLETGELPALGAAVGAAGICEELYQPFSLADGRPPIPGGSVGTPNSSRDGSGIGPVELSENDSRNQRSGGGQDSSRDSRFSSSRNRSSSGGTGPRPRTREGEGAKQSTGDTRATSYGQSNPSTRRSGGEFMQRLDNRFAFSDEAEGIAGRRAIATTTPSAQQSSKSRTRINAKALNKGEGAADDEPFTFGDWLRILIIIALIIGIVVTLGGQFLQVGKSMD